MKASTADRPLTVLGIVDVHGEGRWLSVMGAAVALEIFWWALCWRVRIAPAPQIATYVALAAATLLVALALRRVLAIGKERSSWSALLIGTLLVGLGASFFLPLKYAIPGEIPFWLDGSLAAGERRIFGIDPWRIADGLFGWAIVPVDRVYSTWLPVQSLVLFSVLLLPPSVEKSRALIAYSLAWFLLGVVAAVLCASAGPIFYDRLLGGHRFAELGERLNAGAWMTRSESDAMWASFANRRAGLVSGLSAMPSIHVAMSFWIWLTARNLAPRAAPAALAYAFFIWIASVQLGWHYVSDGLVALLGMVAIWWLARRIAAVTALLGDRPVVRRRGACALEPPPVLTARSSSDLGQTHVP